MKVTTPISLREFIGDSGAIVEGEDARQLRLRGEFGEQQRQIWAEVQKNHDRIGSREVRFYLTESGHRRIEPDDIDFVNEPVHVQIDKHDESGVVSFYTLPGFVSQWDREELSTDDVTLIRVAANFEPFDLCYARVESWDRPDSAETLGFDRSDELCKFPRRLVIDHTGTKVPRSLGYLVVARKPDKNSDVFREFLRVSGVQLAPLFASEVMIEEEVVTLRIGREHPVFAKLQDVEVVDGWHIQEAVWWIVCPDRDAGVRQSIVSNGLARRAAMLSGEMSFGQILKDHLRSVLEDSEAGYRLYVTGATDDALRALNDLRVSLRDEVARVEGAMAALLDRVWKFVAFGVSVVAARVATVVGGGAMNAESRGDGFSLDVFTKLLVFGAIIVVTLSIVVAGFTSARSARGHLEFSERWRSALGRYISKEELEKLSGSSLRRAKTNLWCTLSVAGVTLLVIDVLLLVSWLLGE